MLTQVNLTKILMVDEVAPMIWVHSALIVCVVVAVTLLVVSIAS